MALADLEPEIICCNQRTGKADGMGVIQFNENSFSLNVNIQAARKALSNECVFAKCKINFIIIYTKKFKFLADKCN